MGLLDEQGGLMEQVLDLTNNPQTGAFGGLLEMFKGKGLGDAAASWISTGENQPVSNDQITSAFGSNTIQEISQKLGISGTDASNGLATTFR